MKKTKNVQSQPNNAKLPVAVDEKITFSVEEILREFGSDAATIPDHVDTSEVWDAIIADAKKLIGDDPAPKKKPKSAQPPADAKPPEAPPPTEHSLKENPPADPQPEIIPVKKRKLPPIHALPAREHRPEVTEKAEKPEKKEKTTAKGKAAAISPERAMQIWANRLYSARLRLPVNIMITAAILILTFAGKLMLPGVLDDRMLNIVTAMLWVVCLLLSYDVIAKGLRQLVSLQFGSEALVMITAVVMAVDTVQSLSGGYRNFCAIGALEMTFALWGMREGWRAKLSTTRVAQSGRMQAVCRCEKAWDGDCGLLVAPADAKLFDARSAEKDLVRRICRIFVPTLVLLSLGTALLLNRLNHAPFVRSWLSILLASVPMGLFICYERPYAILARTLERVGAAVGGWPGARAFRGRYTVLLRDEDLFSSDGVVFNGVKLCGGYSVEQVISYAAAATEIAGSPLAPLFDKLCQEQNCTRYYASSYRYYEQGGIGAEIHDDVILLGTLPFMDSMGVRKDDGMKVKQAIYLSVNGELACVFAVKYKAAPEIVSALTAMVEDGHFDLVMTTKDFMVTPELLSDKFGISERQLIYPRVKDRLELPKQKLTGEEQGAVIREGGFAPFAMAACGGRALYSGTRIGIAIVLMAAVIGFSIMTALIYMGAARTVTVFDLLLFLLAWLIPELLTIRWMKHLCRKANFPDQKKEKNI